MQINEANLGNFTQINLDYKNGKNILTNVFNFCKINKKGRVSNKLTNVSFNFTEYGIFKITKIENNSKILPDKMNFIYIYTIYFKNLVII